MPRSNLDTRLQTRIDDFVKEINILVRQSAVEAVQEALTKGAPTRRSATGTTRGRVSKKSGKRVRRSGAQVEALASMFRFIAA